MTDLQPGFVNLFPGSNQKVSCLCHAGFVTAETTVANILIRDAFTLFRAGFAFAGVLHWVFALLNIG